jgi:hypothetical protein
MDDLMAQDWLRACRTNIYDTDVYDRVLELTQSDLNPPRGWRLVQRLIRLAHDDDELWHVGHGPLATVLGNHEALVADDLERLVRTDPKYRQAFRGQMSQAIHRFAEARELNIDT